MMLCKLSCSLSIHVPLCYQFSTVPQIFFRAALPAPQHVLPPCPSADAPLPASGSVAAALCNACGAAR